MKNFLTPEERLRYLIAAMRRNPNITLQRAEIDYTHPRTNPEIKLTILFKYKTDSTLPETVYPKIQYTVSTTMAEKGFSLGRYQLNYSPEFKHYENDTDIYQL